MVPNTDRIRARIVTLDYSEQEAPALLLARPRQAASIVLDTQNLIHRVIQRERRTRRIDVPRMSMLLRFEEEHERRLRQVRRQFMVLLGVLTVAFLGGLGAGLSVHSPSSLRPALDSMRKAATSALNAARSRRPSTQVFAHDVLFGD